MSAKEDLNRPNAAGADSRARATGAVVFADGRVLYGHGIGASGAAVGEICFNTAMTGYQEILTDPSYAGQIITFTFPHIGNVGTNVEDVEAITPAARGVIVRADVTAPANYRSAGALGAWLAARGIVGLSGIDTRALTRLVRLEGPPNAAIAHAPDGRFDVPALARMACEWPGLDGMDLAKDVTARQARSWDVTRWQWPQGYGRRTKARFKVAVLDYGVKDNILRSLASLGAEVVSLPAETGAAEVLAHKPDGIVLSNGPGDPAATGTYAVPTIRTLIDSGKPVFGICLGHQMLALALGGRTVKMHQGHRGANHPVKDLTTGKVEIVSMNHGFTVDGASLPDGVMQTHVSLFDGTNCGIALEGRPVFSVQYHPEASPGPHDSHYLFERFATAIEAHRR